LPSRLKTFSISVDSNVIALVIPIYYNFLKLLRQVKDLNVYNKVRALFLRRFFDDMHIIEVSLGKFVRRDANQLKSTEKDGLCTCVRVLAPAYEMLEMSLYHVKLVTGEII
jgi:hypothetical protein